MFVFMLKLSFFGEGILFVLGFFDVIFFIDDLYSFILWSLCSDLFLISLVNKYKN